MKKKLEFVLFLELSVFFFVNNASRKLHVPQKAFVLAETSWI
jgi:hypothetical protein